MQAPEAICTNRKARHDYEVLDKIEAGIVLLGTEIKAVREHRVSLDGAYATVSDGNVYLVGCNIEPYSHGRVDEHEPKRQRRLLMHRTEIRKFAEKTSERGLTLIPLSLYFIAGRLKVELAICRGRQNHDKRQAIKDREDKKRLKKIRD